MTLVSIIIPAWNRADVILRAVDSALAQTLRGVQVVVVDNGSADGTRDVLGQREGPNLTIVKVSRNCGAAGGRNLGLTAATGDYVGFLDSDDELAPQWAERLMAAIADEAALATCGFAMMNTDGSVRYEHGSEPMGPAFPGLIGPFQAGTFLIERRLLEQLGGYAEGLRYSENTELGLRVAAECAARGRITASVDQPLLRWHHNPEHVYDGAERRASCAYLLDRHGALLARDQRMLSSYRSQLAVWDARLGDLASARRNFRAAWRARPLAVRNALRFAVAALPPLARRAWPPSG